LRGLGFCLIDRDFIVFGIDLDKHRAFLNVLVIVHIHLDYVTGNAGADGIKVSVYLRIVSGFIAAQVSPQEVPAHKHG